MNSSTSMSSLCQVYDLERFRERGSTKSWFSVLNRRNLLRIAGNRLSSGAQREKHHFHATEQGFTRFMTDLSRFGETQNKIIKLVESDSCVTLTLSKFHLSFLVKFNLSCAKYVDLKPHVRGEFLRARVCDHCN